MRIDEIQTWVPAFRAGKDYDVAFGAFFASTESLARGYGRNIIEVKIDLSAALHWTAETSRQFQDYVAECRQHGKSPPGVKTALQRFNRRTDTDLTLAEAIGRLLRERPHRLGWHELDPLAGYVRGFIKERGYDVVVRDHEVGSGMLAGVEYIVFSRRRIRPAS